MVGAAYRYGKSKVNTDPIICLMSTYREGLLPRGAIRSALKATPHVVVFEGLTEIGSEIPESEPTNLGPYKRYLKFTGQWNSETAKRTAMLDYARNKFGKSFWVLLLDADELLVWGEYLPDWLSVLNPKDPKEVVVPIKVTEAAYRKDPETKEETDRFWTDIGPSHLYHSSLIKRYAVGAWQFETWDGQIVKLDRLPAAREPMQGEPHILHRSFLRRGERRFFRANQHEEQRWLDNRGLSRKY